MKRISGLLSVARRVVCSRRFAAAVLAVVTVSMATMLSVKARAVTVSDGTETRTVLTLEQDPREIVEEARMAVSDYDRIDADLDAGTVDITRAMTVAVDADGATTLLHLTEGSVADALARAGIAVGKYDTVSQKTTTAVSDGMLIKVDRVKYEEYTVNETVPFKTVIKYTSNVKAGKTRIWQHGSNGTKTTTYRKTIVNGKVVETKAISEKVTKAAVNCMKYIGSPVGTPLSKAPFTLKLNSKNQPVKYKKLYSYKSCTAYSIGKRGASGLPLGVGTCAVNPKVIPYGTKLWITSADGKYVYGYAIAADTGAFAKGTRTFADLYMGSYAEACYFGRRFLNIYVLS